MYIVYPRVSSYTFSLKLQVERIDNKYFILDTLSKFSAKVECLPSYFRKKSVLFFSISLQFK